MIDLFIVFFEKGFGLNRENQVSDSPDEAIGVPCSILVRERVRTVACGTHHSLAACTTGSVYAWGLNERGQCVPSAKTAVVPTPTQVWPEEKGKFCLFSIVFFSGR